MSIKNVVDYVLSLQLLLKITKLPSLTNMTVFQSQQLEA